MVVGMPMWSLKVAKSNPIASPPTQILVSVSGCASDPAIGALKPIFMVPPVGSGQNWQPSTRRLVPQLRHVLRGDFRRLAAEARGHVIGHGRDLDVGIDAAEGRHRSDIARGR